eukprot:TRINITY_DN3750_c0_g1_i1.p1 TRINITY_DN3750_c0_g1~~TRINITY_DN3750_c0_g1_i1.p1  ORF type:complete len:466 (-),score=97.85 TRINITY_DN3750_c0_g1_i1:605-1933(-)
MVRLLFAAALLGAAAAAPVPESCDGAYNTKPLNTDKPKFVRRVHNGSLYSIMNDNTEMFVVHMYGSPYQMGYAHGELLKPQAAKLYKQFTEFVAEEIDQYLPYLPPEIVRAISVGGLDLALDLTYEATRTYMPRHWLEEMRGLADGLGMSYMDVVRFHMIPELIKAACTMIGAWGPATHDGRLVQVRALDWGTTGPLQQWPALLVYHPTPGTEQGVPFTVLSWAGFLGTLTGYSSTGVGVCEKVWLHYKGTASRFGIPWNFLLRDVLQFSESADILTAVSRLADANRTCSIFVGVGSGLPRDGSNPRFVGIEYSHQTLDVYDGANYPNYSPGHPFIPGTMYWDKHTQPSKHTCLPEMINASAGVGQFTAEAAYRNVTAVHATGDLHIMVMDPKDGMLYVSNAGPSSMSGGKPVSGQPAYARSFTRFDANELFATRLDTNTEA